MFYFQIAYPDVTTITDTEIQNLNIILVGFTMNQLSKLKITSLDTIYKLGSISKWTNDQVKTN